MRKTILRFAAAAAITGIAMWLCLRMTQETRLAQARQLLAQSESQISSGSLKGARQTLDLVAHTVDFQYTLPGERSVQRGVLGALFDHRQLLHRRVNATRVILADVAHALESKHLALAQRRLAQELSRSPHDRSLLATQEYVNRLAVQDFTKASDLITNLGSLRSDLPSELGLDEFVQTFASVVKADETSNHARQAAIAAAVRSAINSTTNESEQFRPAIKGKVMIWDYTKKNVERAYEMLPDALRASPEDARVTIFCILNREQIVRGYYSISNEPGYQEEMTIGVVYWPQRSSPGSVTVWGGDPVSQRVVTYAPEYGSSVKIRDWIESLPRGR